MKTKTNPAASEVGPLAADSQGAQKPPKTSVSEGGFFPCTPDFAVFDSQPETKGGPAAQPSRRVEKRPEIGPYLEGKLCLALAMGLSQREAENWVDHSQSTISRLMRLDEKFAEDVQRFTQLVRLHPLLRVYMSNQKSWRASKWLLKFLKARVGEASVPDLLAEFPRLFQKLRPTLYSDELLAPEFEEHYPIGDR